MDCKDARNRYMQAMQLGLIVAGSSMRGLSVLLSLVETSLRTQTALEIAQEAYSSQLLVDTFVHHVY